MKSLSTLLTCCAIAGQLFAQENPEQNLSDSNQLQVDELPEFSLSAESAPNRFRTSFGLERSGASVLGIFDEDQTGGISPYVQVNYGNRFGLDFIARGSLNLFYDDIEDQPIDPSDIGIPVRSDIRLYRDKAVTLDQLKVDYQFRSGPNLFGRVSAGLLETQYGGIDAEMIYAPEDYPFAIGAQIAHVTKRDHEDTFGFSDYETTTGHITVYYDTFYPGWLLSASYGKYLAGDTGATLTAAKRFQNGWEIKGELTATEHYFDTEDSDFLSPKLTVYIPLGLVRPGNTSRFSYSEFGIGSDTDAGVKLRDSNSLYNDIRGWGSNGYEKRWGAF